MPSITKAEYVAMTGMIERLTGEAATLREDLEEALSISKNLADDARAEREVAETLRQERDTAHAALMKMSAEVDRKYSECAQADRERDAHEGVKRALVDVIHERDEMRQKLAIATDRGNVLMQDRDAARTAFTQVNATFAAATERIVEMEQERDALTRENEAIIASKGLRPHTLLSPAQVTHICWTTITSMDWKKGLSAKQLRDLMFVGERCIEEAVAVMSETLEVDDAAPTE